MTDKRTYQKSPLTNSQEKLLLEEINKAARVADYDARYRDWPIPQAILRAQAAVKKFDDQRHKDRNARLLRIRDASEAARKAVIFAESKEAAQKAVADLSANLAKLAKGGKA